jgi:hypothetical protein
MDIGHRAERPVHGILIPQVMLQKLLARWLGWDVG